MPLTADSKVCLLCNLEKPIHKFSRLSPNGLRQSRCNPCRAIVNKQKLSELPPEERERRRIKNLERRKVYVSELSEAQKRKALLKSKYGISLETFDTLLEQQGNKCALCSGSEPGGKHDIFHVDHCHSSGSVRGLLCHKCNIALGFLGDCQTAIQKALDYVTPSNFPEINQSWPFQSKGGRRV